MKQSLHGSVPQFSRSSAQQSGKGTRQFNAPFSSSVSPLQAAAAPKNDKKKAASPKFEDAQLAAAAKNEKKKGTASAKFEDAQLAAAPKNDKKKTASPKFEGAQLAPAPKNDKKKTASPKFESAQLAPTEKGKKKGTGTASMKQEAPVQGKIPGGLREHMESSMGADFSDVNIHVGSKASSVGALAYAQGNDIHFAQGKFNPESKSGQQLLGHELAHVVQQRQGRVQATTSVNGLPVNDDPKLEKEADSMGAKAASSFNK